MTLRRLLRKSPVAFNSGSTYFTGSWYSSGLGGGLDSSGNFHFAANFGATTPTIVLTCYTGVSLFLS